MSDRFLLWAGLLGCVACASQEAPLNVPPADSTAAPTALAAASAETSASATPASSPSASASASSAAATAPAAAASGASPEATPRIDEDNVYAPGRQATSAVPPLLDETGKPLPQTPDRPTPASATFGARMALLGQAISSGNADTALPAFFPVVAYAQVKDIPNPERDWEARLVSAFRRDIADYRKQLGQDAPSAMLVAVEVPEPSAKLMKPGSEGNRVPYYRVLRSALRFRLASGQEKKLELTSMISWRGEWYVVHLHGFK